MKHSGHENIVCQKKAINRRRTFFPETNLETLFGIAGSSLDASVSSRLGTLTATSTSLSRLDPVASSGFARILLTFRVLLWRKAICRWPKRCPIGPQKKCTPERFWIHFPCRKARLSSRLRYFSMRMWTILFLRHHKRSQDATITSQSNLTRAPEPGSDNDAIPVQVPVGYKCATIPPERQQSIVSRLFHSF